MVFFKSNLHLDFFGIDMLSIKMTSSFLAQLALFFLAALRFTLPLH